MPHRDVGPWCAGLKAGEQEPFICGGPVRSLISATGHLIGIISRADVLSVFTRPDADIRREATEEMIAESLLEDSRRFTVTVHDGIVTLAGCPEADQAGRDLVEVLRKSSAGGVTCRPG